MHDSFFILSPDPWPMLSERIISRTICLKVEISDFCIWRDGEMKNSELFCVAFELHVKGKVKAVISEHEHFSVVKLELLDFVLAFILEEEVQLF